LRPVTVAGPRRSFTGFPVHAIHLLWAASLTVRVGLSQALRESGVNPGLTRNGMGTSYGSPA